MYGLPPTNHLPLSVMTVGYAHAIMQAHIDCPIAACPVKRQAKARLVEAKHLVPAGVDYTIA
ncbi:hypothetical protein HLB23_13250 [Nocardia uniformis]|uniref:Uncharacterized protein n=1 Tax=Nocardia uniformis TaxID=53432 RepID=A0A849C7F2_9NOCA|nr:hypothetical protein [Nocardia uniformis]NNH70819.1 hypothetical protein [Nocardia uniformis]